LGPAFPGHHVEAIVSRWRRVVPACRIGEEIPGQLLAGELVEPLVRVEGVDDVIPIRENPLILVSVKSDRVGEARDIQPPDREPFPEMRTAPEGASRRRFIGLCGFWDEYGRPVKSSETRRWRTSGAASGDGWSPFRGELGLDESVDRISSFRRHRFGQRRVSPVRFVNCPFRDPLFEERFLAIGQRLVRLLRRHRILLESKTRAMNSLSSGRPGTIGTTPSSVGLRASSREIEPQSGLARLASNPWQWKQVSDMMGRMSRLKDTGSADAALRETRRMATGVTGHAKRSLTGWPLPSSVT